MDSSHIFRPALYRFLRYILDEPLEKTILDCGAGGRIPPLALFHQYGYKTTGIDISQNQLERAKQYCDQHEINLNIQHGDMRNIPFEDESFSFIYSISSIYHLTKKDSAIAIQEMERVLKPGGMIYVDFLSIEDGNYGDGEAVDPIQSPGEFRQKEAGGEVIHSYFEDGEPDKFFNDSKIIFKNKNLMEMEYEGTKYKPGYTGYITQKPIKN